ncbi:MAG: pyruvate dehydrogenase (acetyl-transferring) E1 component subunit alpha [Burkholderiales bacterium]|nr:MAG: pyruvate dehydrogenase (acetyl-transferring) E1 component subunit alpha [Burkholderiales bacterium]
MKIDVPFTRILGPDGKVQPDIEAGTIDLEALKQAYWAMVLARTFDTKAIALQRTGKLGTYASSLGQEAVGVGVARAMQPNDVLLPTFREHGAQLVRGVTLTELFLFWGGDERGCDFAGPRQDFPVCVPIATHAPHAAGVALALKLEGEGGAAVAILGDGATSKGDFYEAMNVAGAWQLPALLFVCNNQWAISVPRSAQSAAETLAQKALAAGFEGEQVDGNDVVAVEHVTGRALAAIRAASRPHLIEAITYRMSDHTTADDASRYRSDDEVSGHWHEDPIARVRTCLVEANAWSTEDEEALLARCTEQIEDAAQQYLGTAPQAPESIFDFTYAQLPADLRAQRAALLGEAGADG